MQHMKESTQKYNELILKPYKTYKCTNKKIICIIILTDFISPKRMLDIIKDQSFQ